MKTSLQEYSGVACSYSSAPAMDNGFYKHVKTVIYPLDSTMKNCS